MTITLPDGMKDDLERRARASGYETVDEFVIDLLHIDAADEDLLPEELGFNSQEELETTLLKSLDSGPPIAVTPEFWSNLRKTVANRVE